MNATDTRPISIARVALEEDEIEAALAVLRSGALRQGRACDEFERAFAEQVGARHAISVSSGTAALHLAWLSILQPGDHVLVPAFTFIATASTVVFAGGVPVFCDVDPLTGLIDVQDARRRLNPRVRAITPVHLYGNVCDVAAVRALADQHGLRVVWDAAQAHAARAHDRDVGSLDDLVCYSFYPTKNMTTGEGGMITTNDTELARQLRLLRSHGQARKYHHTVLGLNYRLTDVQAAIGLAQLRKLDAWVQQRRRNAALLDDLLAAVPGIDPMSPTPGTLHAYHQYTVRVDSGGAGCTRDELQAELQSRRIETAVHYPKPLHQQPVFAELATGVRLPASERLAETVLSLPIHPLLSETDLRRVADGVAASCPGT